MLLRAPVCTCAARFSSQQFALDSFSILVSWFFWSILQFLIYILDFSSVHEDAWSPLAALKPLQATIYLIIQTINENIK